MHFPPTNSHVRALPPAIFALLVLGPLAFAANKITGVVHNGSTGLPAAGEDVILIRLDQGMEEESRAKIDSQGAFTLPVLYPAKSYLVRVVHQGVTYDHVASIGSTLGVEIFDAALQVQDVAGTAEIMRVGTNGKMLHVSDMYDIRNLSVPPTTQAGQRTFEFYIPSAAKIDSVLAAGPGGIGVMISAVPAPGEPGHYTVNFPLRPGDTKFAVNYDVPYAGRASFHPRIAYPMQQVAIMIPPAMRFKSAPNSFHPLGIQGSDFQAQAMNRVPAGRVPWFEISGRGVLPILHAQANARAQSAAEVVASPTAAFRGAGSNMSNTRGPTAGSSSSYFMLWLVLAAAIGLICGCVILKRRRRRNVNEGAVLEPQPSEPKAAGRLLEELKQELFDLERDRVRGAITDADYRSTRFALEQTLKRTMAKAG